MAALTQPEVETSAPTQAPQRGDAAGRDDSARRDEPPRRDDRLTVAATLALVGALPACLDVARRGVGIGAVGAVAALGCALAATLAATRRPGARAAATVAAAIAGAGLAASTGRAPIVELVVGTALIGSALSARREVGGPRPVAAAAALLLGAGAWVRSGSTTALTIGLAGGGALALATHVWAEPTARLDRWLVVAVRRVTSMVTTAGIVALSIPAIYLPSLLSWPVRRWRRRRRARLGTGWRPRRVAWRDEISDARQPFAPEVSAIRRARNAVAALAVLGIVALAAYTLADAPQQPVTAAADGRPAPRLGTAPPRIQVFRLADSPAFAGVPWAAEIQDEHDHMQSPPVSDDFGIGNVSTTHTHITDGVRRSAVSTCRCPEVKLWWFGGSAAFGWYERDEQTIPSQLVRLAEADGIRLTIENRAIAGSTMWQEYSMFSALATFSSERPDMTVFFDGFNDVLAAAAVAAQTGEDPTEKIPNVLPMAALGPLRDPNLVFRNPGGPRAIGESAADKYTGLAADAAALARLHGMALTVVLQPDAFASPRHLPETSLSFDVPDASVFAGGQLFEVFEAAERRMGDRVLNLRNTFDDVGEHVFADAVHMNETGARITAEALYARLRPQLHQLADRRR